MSCRTCSRPAVLCLLVYIHCIWAPCPYTRRYLGPHALVPSTRAPSNRLTSVNWYIFMPPPPPCPCNQYPRPGTRCPGRNPPQSPQPSRQPAPIDRLQRTRAVGYRGFSVSISPPFGPHMRSLRPPYITAHSLYLYFGVIRNNGSLPNAALLARSSVNKRCTMTKRRVS